MLTSLKNSYSIALRKRRCLSVKYFPSLTNRVIYALVLSSYCVYYSIVCKTIVVAVLAMRVSCWLLPYIYNFFDGIQLCGKHVIFFCVRDIMLSLAERSTISWCLFGCGNELKYVNAHCVRSYRMKRFALNVLLVKLFLKKNYFWWLILIGITVQYCLVVLFQ